MGEESPDYKKLYQEQVRKTQEESTRRQRAEEAREDAERATRQTTLPELLHHAYENLERNLRVQTDKSQSTRGNPANATNKVRPMKLQLWRDFPESQEKIWKQLVQRDFMSKRLFTSTNTLKENGEDIRRRLMSSEMDLHTYERFALNNHVSSVLEKIHEDLQLRRGFRLQGTVMFENHANTLSVEDLEADVDDLKISERGRRRSPRLAEQAKAPKGSAKPIKAAPSSKCSRPKSDQICVYNCAGSYNASRIPVLVIEYKAPHKVTLGHITEGLEDMDVEDVTTDKDDDNTSQKCRRLVAAVICQAYSYMIQAGLEFGCVRTGEATIFLRVPEDPRTVYYFLSVPTGDVGASTGWASGSDGPNRLHLTSLGQMIPFTLRAMQRLPRPHSWQRKWLEELPRWQIAVSDVSESISTDEAPTSEYRPPRGLDIRASPIQLHSRQPRIPPSCQDELPNNLSSHSESDASNPETPSKSSVSGDTKGKRELAASKRQGSTQSKQSDISGRQYCTTKCLLGLIKGGLLDAACPNVEYHGSRYHEISHRKFVDLLYQQLQLDMDNNFTVIGRYGARGVPFAVRLASHGYTVVAKCSPSEFGVFLQHEAEVYGQLCPIQGINIPVFLGEIELPQPYYFEGFVELSCAILLSFSGEPIYKHVTVDNCATLCKQAVDCIAAVDRFDIVHNDLRLPNVLYDSNTNRVTIIDFDRASKKKPVRIPLGPIVINQKRKRVEDDQAKAVQKKLLQPGTETFCKELQTQARQNMIF